MTDTINFSETDFYKQVKQTLDHFHDVHWLGEYSPLATPYFLGTYLLRKPKSEQISSAGRGGALKALLEKVTKKISYYKENKEKQYEQLLRSSYFNHQTLKSICEELGISRATYYRYRQEAIQVLGDLLIQTIHPALRLEQPIHPQPLVGRDDLLQSCLAHLQQGQVVGLTGPGGIGKTMLAAHLAAHFPERSIFWYTFQLGLTDRLKRLLFSFAYFLQSQSASQNQSNSSLWSQLMADKGEVNMKVALSLLRYDLAQLVNKPPLLCFDEVDLLRPETEAHAQLLNFLESWSVGVPCLIIGQQLPIQLTNRYQLSALSPAEMALVLQGATIQLSPENSSQLYDYTKGNPRLLNLFITLQAVDEVDFIKTLTELSQAPSLEALLLRVWQRLDKLSQKCLTELVVYRRPVPIMAWTEEDDRQSLQQLVKYALVQSDQQQNVSLLPAFRTTLYNTLPPENRDIHHLNAAAIRVEGGEFTATAYHLVQARHPELAIRLWYQKQTIEINQGQAEAALSIFSEVSRNQLTNQTDRERLALIRSDLEKLKGNYARAREDLYVTLWRTPILKARAKRLEGDIAEINGQFEKAENAYQEGLQIVEMLCENEVVNFHRDIGWIYRRQRQLDAAWHEVNLAYYEVENLRGHVQRDRGNLVEAKKHYQTALNLAESLKHSQGEAKTSNVLAGVLARQEEYETAISYWEKSYQLFKTIGKQTSLASVRVNQSFGYSFLGQPDKAIDMAQEAMILFERFEQPYGLATAAQALAEAHLGLNQLKQAEVFARKVIQLEEVSILPDGLRTLGEIKLAQGNLIEGETFIQQSLTLSQQNKDDYLEAYAWRALGQVYSTKHKDSSVEKWLQKAVEALKKGTDLFLSLKLPHEVEKTEQLLNQIT